MSADPPGIMVVEICLDSLAMDEHIPICMQVKYHFMRNYKIEISIRFMLVDQLILGSDEIIEKH